MEFRLFATGDGTKAQRITLRSPTPQAAGNGLVSRPQAYYFSGEATEHQLHQYRYAAITGDEIREELNRRWKGCELPWRVSVIRVPAIPRTSAKSTTKIVPDGRKRCRKGKKTRIAIRKRVAKVQVLKVEKVREAEEKDQAEKEKRNARNREKKIKRRQKLRVAKAVQKDEA